MEEKHTPEQPQLTKAEEFKLDLFFWLQALVMALVVLILLFTFVGRIISVDGTSMLPTLHHKDLLMRAVGIAADLTFILIREISAYGASFQFCPDIIERQGKLFHFFRFHFTD